MALLAAWLLAGGRAGAQSATDRATAEILFNDALALLENKKPAEACRKLEESQRLDPGLGTLLYLADCYQQMGRSASAWATFREAAYVAKDHGDEREALALEHAQTLEPKLSYLTVEVVTPGVTPEIKHDGEVVNQAVWGAAFPVDPGAHLIEASAAGRKPWSETVNVAEGPRQQRVVVPELEIQAPEPTPALTAPQTLPLDVATPSNTQKTLGWVLLGVGSASVITGGILALLARSDDSDANAQCRPDRPTLCSPAGVRLGESAETKATWAGVSAGLGLAAIGTGVTLLVLAPTASPAGEVAFGIAPGGGEVSFQTAF